MKVPDRGAVVTELLFSNDRDFFVFGLCRNVDGCGGSRCGRGRTR